MFAARKYEYGRQGICANQAQVPLGSVAGVGSPSYLMVGAATILVLIVLWAIPRFQQVTNARRTYVYEAVCPLDEKKYETLMVEILLMRTYETKQIRVSHGAAKMFR